ncbi:hypothetical protein ACH3XW_15525 [Acanthocheilonema viteae]
MICKQELSHHHHRSLSTSSMTIFIVASMFCIVNFLTELRHLIFTKCFCFVTWQDISNILTFHSVHFNYANKLISF